MNLNQIHAVRHKLALRGAAALSLEKAETILKKLFEEHSGIDCTRCSVLLIRAEILPDRGIARFEIGFYCWDKQQEELPELLRKFRNRLELSPIRSILPDGSNLLFCRLAFNGSRVSPAPARGVMAFMAIEADMDNSLCNSDAVAAGLTEFLTDENVFNRLSPMRLVQIILAGAHPELIFRLDRPLPKKFRLPKGYSLLQCCGDILEIQRNFC